MKNRLFKGIGLLLVLALLCTVSAFADDTVRIGSAAELAALGGKDFTGTLELTQDIDMTGVAMQPITSFAGTFNGNGYTIKNLAITAEKRAYSSTAQGVALFETFTGTARDLVFENPSITLTDGQMVGTAVLCGVVGEDGATIENVGIVGGSISMESTKTTYAGGLVGDAENTSLTVKNCFTEAKIAYTGSAKPKYNYFGGMLGYMTNVDLAFENCAVLGDVAAHTYSGIGYAGGFVGIINGSNAGHTIDFTNCYFSGKVTGASVCGFAYSGRYASPSITAKGCYYDNEKNKSASSWSSFNCFGNKAKVIGTPEGIATADFAALALDGFEIKDSYPYPAWFVAPAGPVTLTITVDPADATVVLTDAADKEITLTAGDAGSYTVVLEAGDYTLTVTPAEGDTEHTASVQTVQIGKKDRTVKVALVAKTYAVAFDLTPATAELALHRESAEGELLAPTAGTTYTLTKGDYFYTVSDFGYVTKSGTLTVTGDTAVSLTLDESERYPLAFTVYPRRAGAVVTLTRADGDKREMTGTDGTYSLPAGSYDYKITADGYKTKSGAVLVPETDALTFTLVAGDSWDGSVSAALAGAGTEDEPYRIANAADLAYLSQALRDTIGSPYKTAYYTLEADIDLGGITWSPIGKTSVSPFAGHFDGKGHTISGLTVSDESDVYAYYGLFGCLSEATVKNLTVEGEVFCTERSALVGGLAGAAVGNTTIENCATNVLVSAEAGASVGGMVGICRKSDSIGYEWVDNTVRFVGCVNVGAVMQNGEDKDTFSQGRVGGLVGYSKNCVQFENCANLGSISGANIAAGICGNTGSSQGDGCHPYLKSCYNAGDVYGVLGAYAIYGKGSMGASYVTDCYTVADGAENAYVYTRTAEEMRTDAFAALLGDAFTRDDAVNGGYPHPMGTVVPAKDESLSVEADKYVGVLAIPAAAAVGDRFSFLADGAAPNADIRVSCVQTTEESYLTRLANGEVVLAKTNDTGVTVTETVTLLFVGDAGQLRRTVTVVLAPAPAARRALADTLAKIYASKRTPDEWVVFDMAAYAILTDGIEDAPRVSADAVQNYVNLAIDGLNKSYTLPKDRAKAEIIMGVLGIDTEALYPVNSATAMNNAAALRAENIGSDYTTAVWALLADMQGKVNYTNAQKKALVATLLRNQRENGMFSYTYGLNTYTDADTTGWALAALSRFVLDTRDTYGVRADAQKFVDAALAGLSAELGANGSYGNINTDAAVITGLLALGIDPATDTRFSRGGCTLADAPMLYVNEAKNGFVTAYADGDAGIKAEALATEQGFRALVALEIFEARGKQPYNIFACNLIAADDAEAILLRTPARATGIGTTELPAEPDKDAATITVTYTLTGLKKKVWASGELAVKEGSTVYHLLRDAAAANGITVVGLEKGYVSAMTYDGETLAEFEHGKSSGWLYYVNGELPKVGIADYTLKAGDKVEWLYTSDYKQESGGSSMGGGSRREPDTKTDGKTEETPTTPAAPAEWVNPFTDVKADDWYFDAVRFVSEEKLFSGMTATEFAPGVSLSRAMLVTVLFRREGAPAAKAAAFTDVAADAWYAKAVAWAAANGIVKGVTETEFAPDAPISREQLATLLYRYAEYKQYASKDGDKPNFTDADRVSAYAVPALTWATANGIVAGRDDGSVAPQDGATRAECAVVMMRLLALAK